MMGEKTEIEAPLRPQPRAVAACKEHATTLEQVGLETRERL